MKNLTAMTQLINELRDYKRTTYADKLVITYWIVIAEKLLEKEKEQIIDARQDGIIEGFKRTNNSNYTNMVESFEYYNETYENYFD